MTQRSAKLAPHGRVNISSRRPLAVELREILLFLLLVSTAVVIMTRWSSYATAAISVITGATSQVLDLSTVDWTVGSSIHKHKRVTHT